jgi:nucleoside-diphosphate-sugar epimerase
MKVLVTGGAGRVGLAVVRYLAAQGHQVTAAGRTPDREVEGAAYAQLDATDLDAVRRVVAGHDKVIHLAAIPSPGGVPGPELFRINCDSTYNVLEACVEHGINHVAIASSINSLGQKYGVKPLPIRYFPIDEDHPRLHSDPYSFSKKVTEDIARYFWDKNGLSTVSLRIPGVFEPDWEHAGEGLRRDREQGGRGHASDFWVMIDARDSASAFAAAIEPCYEGAHVCFVNDTANVLGLPSRELASRWYAYVTEWREPVEADEALVSPKRFMALTGWQPRFSWRGVAAGGPVP